MVVPEFPLPLRMAGYVGKLPSYYPSSPWALSWTGGVVSLEGRMKPKQSSELVSFVLDQTVTPSSPTLDVAPPVICASLHSGTAGNLPQD